MEGSIRQRTPGSWEILYYVDGKKKQQTIHGTKRDAERKKREIIRAIELGEFTAPSKMTLAELLNLWLQDVAGRVEVTTKERYAGVIRNHLSLEGGVYVTSITPIWVQSLYSRKASKLAPNTVRFHHNILCQALDMAVKLGVIPRNPAACLAPPGGRQEVKGILDEHAMLALMLAGWGTPYYAPTVLAVTTGMRIGEICGLKWEDVDFDNNRLVVRRTVARLDSGEIILKDPKTKRSRRPVDLPQIATSALLMVPRTADLIFHNEGKPIGTAAFAMGIKRLCKSLGLNTSVHGLRHSHASHLMRLEEHPKVVSERLGHSSVAFTMDTYSHTLPSQQSGTAGRVNEAFSGATVALGKKEGSTGTGV